MPLLPSTFDPPAWLRNPHMQSVLAASPLREARARRRLQQVRARHDALVLDAGDGVRLQGVASLPDAAAPRALALLLHGWEGSAESSYMQLTAARLLQAGFAVFRLDFRDHGDSHHLNEGLFHSNRLDEVVGAARALADRWPALPLVAAGYSLGGNFALRLALHAPAAGVPLRRVAAVCPLLDPARTMDAMEAGPAFYMRHFEYKWRRSLARKRALFPQAHTFGDEVLRLRMRALTAWMVAHNTGFPHLDAYFDGYSVASDRLQALPVPADVLMAEDDPVIPADEFRRIAGYPNIALELAPHGGHCGFIEGVTLDGYAERWVAAKLAAAAGIDALQAAPARSPS
ncbi:YheT family hydrolase [Thermomonas fusca]|uniref:YheT family hydrolase n=1 Tax=Thermomonas fusca TaxID=215690 RepID=UPI003CCC717E